MKSYVIISLVILDSTRKSDENHNDKENETNYLIYKVLEKFNQTLSIRIIRNAEAFPLHYLWVFGRITRRIWSSTSFCSYN